MGILDIILLICFIPGIVSGISKGFVKQVVEFGAILGGAWAAFHFSSSLSIWLGQYFSLDPVVLHIISFILIMLIFALIMNMVANLLTRILNIIALGWLNGVLGLIFGIFKVALVLGLLIMVFEGINNSFQLLKPGALDDSVVYNALKEMGQKVFPYLKEFASSINV